MSRRRSYEQQAADIEEQIRRLQERKREALQRHGEEERKAEARVRAIVGRLVLDLVPGGWRSLDGRQRK